MPSPAAFNAASLIVQLVKNPPAMQETWFSCSVGKIHWRRDRLLTPVFLDFPSGSAGKESTCNAGDLVQSLGREDPLETGKATHSSILGLSLWLFRHRKSEVDIDRCRLTYSGLVGRDNGNWGFQCNPSWHYIIFISAHKSESIARLGRFPGECNGYLLQYSFLGYSMDRGTWQTTVHGVARSQTWLSN